MSDSIFDQETWEQLPSMFAHLPQTVVLVVWGYPAESQREADAVTLCQTLAEQFEPISFALRPRRVNYPFYPVIGVMGQDDSDAEWLDFGVRLIGLPSGYQMTSLVTAVQAVSFRGMTLEPQTRIQLSRLNKPVQLEMFTSAENEGGAIMAQAIFSMAVVNSHIRSFLIMADQFPESVVRFSMSIVPHTIINGRVHVPGVVDEDRLLKQMAHALKSG